MALIRMGFGVVGAPAGRIADRQCYWLHITSGTSPQYRGLQEDINPSVFRIQPYASPAYHHALHRFEHDAKLHHRVDDQRLPVGGGTPILPCIPLVLEAVRFPSTGAPLVMTPTIASTWYTGSILDLTDLVDSAIVFIAAADMPLRFVPMAGTGSYCETDSDGASNAQRLR